MIPSIFSIPISTPEPAPAPDFPDIVRPWPDIEDGPDEEET